MPLASEQHLKMLAESDSLTRTVEQYVDGHWAKPACGHQTFKVHRRHPVQRDSPVQEPLETLAQSSHMIWDAAEIVGCAGQVDAPEDASAALSRSLVPLFDAFWQGRLIPGAQIESLPFIEVWYPVSLPSMHVQSHP